MRRSTLNLIVDVVSFAVLASMITTGLLVRFILPPGSRGGRGLTLWDLDRHDWGDVHFGLAVALLGLLLLHLALHWSWVYQAMRTVLWAREPASKSNFAAKRVAIGMIVLSGCIALIAAFLFFASANVSYARGGGADDDEFHGGPTVEQPSDRETPFQGGQHRRERRGSQRP